MGAILLTASHNPGGPTEDFGIKYNAQNGGPALETLTNLIYEKSKTITTYKQAEVGEIDLSHIKVTEGQLDDGHSWRVKVVDTCAEYTQLMKTLFDFDSIKKLIERSDFSMCFDGMHGISGPYALEILGRELGVPE